MLLESRLDALVAAGLTGINISIDSLKPAHREITRRTGLTKALRVLQRAAARLPSVKVNVVAMRGVNDDELLDFAELTQRLATVRFIELMPFDSSQV